MTKINLKKSESLHQSYVNREFFYVSVLSQFGDATSVRGQAEGEIFRSVGVIRIIQQKQYFSSLE